MFGQVAKWFQVTQPFSFSALRRYNNSCMARRLFYVDQIAGDHAEIRDQEAHHLVRVLRVEVGQVYEISDQTSFYLAEITKVQKALVTFHIKEKLQTPPQSLNVTLYASLFKFDHFEWMLEKVTELGVTAIQPVITERSEKGTEVSVPKRTVGTRTVGTETSVPKRMERWQRILHESGQQSRRLRIPAFHSAIALRKAIDTATGLRLLLDEKKGIPSLLTCLPNPADDISLLLGPEGGWTDRERESILAAGWIACSLGPNVLRAETAAIAALSVISVWAMGQQTDTL